MKNFTIGERVYHLSQDNEFSKTVMIVSGVAEDFITCSWMTRKGKYYVMTFLPLELIKYE